MDQCLKAFAALVQDLVRFSAPTIVVHNNLQLQFQGI